MKLLKVNKTFNKNLISQQVVVDANVAQGEKEDDESRVSFLNFSIYNCMHTKAGQC